MIEKTSGSDGCVVTLQLKVEGLLKSDADQLSEIGYVLKMRKELLAGLSKIKLLKRVCQKDIELLLKAYGVSKKGTKSALANRL